MNRQQQKELDNVDLRYSPLSRYVTRNGKTVAVDIYRDTASEEGWALEIEDEYLNSTCWEDPFPTDTEALACAMGKIDEEGIESVIGKPPAK